MLRWLQNSMFTLALASGASVQAGPVASQQPIGEIEKVAEIRGAMPTGVAVSTSGRIFINYPRWGDAVEFTVAEIVNGKPVAFPSAALNRLGDVSTQEMRIVSAQSVVVDPTGVHLWIVDTGSLRPQPISYGGPKLMKVDLRTNQVIDTILIDQEALEPETYLNDVRFLLPSGSPGYAFITDSSVKGGIIVVDLKSKQSWRRLGDTSFTRSDPGFVPIVEAQVLMLREQGKPPQKFNVGSDGLAISGDGQQLYFRSLTSRHLYSVPTAALINRTMDESTIQKQVVDYGQVAGASDGLEADASGGIYLTDYEHNAIHRFTGSEATMETVVYSAEAIWPDSLSLADNGYLYFTANQLNRQAQFHQGVDKRVQPYVIFRVRTNHQPIRQANSESKAGGTKR